MGSDDEAGLPAAAVCNKELEVKLVFGDGRCACRLHEAAEEGEGCSPA